MKICLTLVIFLNFYATTIFAVTTLERLKAKIHVIAMNPKCLNITQQMRENTADATNGFQGGDTLADPFVKSANQPAVPGKKAKIALCAHGLTDSPASWRDLSECMVAGQTDVWAFRLSGHGRRLNETAARQRQRQTTGNAQAWVDDMECSRLLAEAAGFETIPCGFSTGGNAAMESALRGRGGSPAILISPALMLNTEDADDPQAPNHAAHMGLERLIGSYRKVTKTGRLTGINWTIPQAFVSDKARLNEVDPTKSLVDDANPDTTKLNLEQNAGACGRDDSFSYHAIFQIARMTTQRITQIEGLRTNQRTSNQPILAATTCSDATINPSAAREALRALYGNNLTEHYEECGTGSSAGHASTMRQLPPGCLKTSLLHPNFTKLCTRLTSWLQDLSPGTAPTRGNLSRR